MSDFVAKWPSKTFVRNFSLREKEILKKCLEREKPKNDKVNIKDFVKMSSEFPLKFPLESCRVQSQPIKLHNKIKQQIASAYPVMHERVLYLMLDFLEYKLQYGSSIEKELYKDMNLLDFVERLLIKSCASFTVFNDSYKLLSGETGCGIKYLQVGTDNEQEPLTLQNVLSYDEIKISAFLCLTTFSELLNRKTEKDFNKFEKEAVMLRIPGPHLDYPNKLDYQDIVISKKQNISVNGYGGHNANKLLSGILHKERKKLLAYRQIWNRFYGEEDFLYNKVSINNERFSESLQTNDIFDNLIMKKRFSIAIDTLLLEANERGAQSGKLTYIHVGSINLVNWNCANHLEELYMETFQRRLTYLMSQLNNIGVIHFSGFSLKEWRDLKDDYILTSKVHRGKGITIFISKRNPSEKLPPPYDDMLLVVSFAGNCNSLPGNEFWLGYLNTSTDASITCNTLISEILNPHINSDYICAKNLHIASPKYGIKHIKDYMEKLLK